MKPKQIEDGIFLVGSADISDSRDCMVYLLDLGELVMIDAGAGPGVNMILSNIRYFGFDPAKVFNNYPYPLPYRSCRRKPT